MLGFIPRVASGCLSPLSSGEPKAVTKTPLCPSQDPESRKEGQRTATEEKGKGILGRLSCAQRPGQEWTGKVRGGDGAERAKGSEKKLRFQTHHLAIQPEEPKWRGERQG